MVKEKGRAGKIAEFLDLAERILHWLPKIIGVIGSSWVMGWAAFVTTPLAKYAPFSWVLAAFVGAFLFIGIYWLYAYARLMLAKAIRYRSPIAESINPLDISFDKKRINVAVLADPVTGYIHDKTFVECEILGAATIVFFGCSFNELGGIYSCDFVVLDDKKEFPFFNMKIFQNCIFKRCKFYNLVMLFPAESASQLDKISNGEIKWLTKQ